MGFFAVYIALIVSCVAAVIRPAYGCIAFYFFVTLDPTWNWRWAFPVDPGFQKWIAIATLLGFALQFRRFRFLSIESKWVFFALISFFLIACLSMSLSLYSDNGVRYLDVLWRVLTMVAISLLTVTNRKAALLMALVCIVGQGYNAFRINEEYFQIGHCRYAYSATWSNKGVDNNGYSILTIPVLAISLGFSLSSARWSLRSLAGIIAILQAHQIMLMDSRGGMLGALFAVLICAWYCPKTLSTIWTLSLGAIIGVILAGPPVIKEFSSAFKKQGERDASAESRLHIWRASLALLAEHPLIGVGPDASRFHVLKHYKFTDESWRNQKALHNLFFEVSCDNGLPGAAIYFSIFLFPWYSIWRSRRGLLYSDATSCALALSVLAGIPGYFLSSMFSSGSLIETSYVLPILGCAVLSYKTVEMQEAARNSDAETAAYAETL